MAYSPKYVSADEIPVQIPDDYDKSEKQDALEMAEASAELDLKDGNSLTSSEVTTIVKSAIKQKATCELAKGAEHPDDAALTDLSNTGSDKADYAAEAFCDRYDELIDKIRDSGLVGTQAGDTSPYVYNTNDPSPRDYYHEVNVDEDSFDG